MLGTLKLCVVLAAFWLLLSGKTDVLFMWLGLVSVLVSALIGEHLWPRGQTRLASSLRLGALLRYGVWLAGEIVRANMTVMRAILRANPVLSPTLVKYRARSRTAMGRAILANSITLTPGTIVVAMDGSAVLIHALLDPMADEDGFALMDKKAAHICHGDDAP